MILTVKNKPSVDSHPELPLDPDAAEPGRYKWPLHFAPTLQLAVFVGGYTTFSTASFETIRLIEEKQYIPALLHGGGHICLSVLAAGAGLWLA